MGLDKLTLVLDPPGHTYRPGDVITGKLVVGVDKDKPVTEIYVKLKGSCKVRWSESDNDGKSETYSARETYVDQHVTLHRDLVLTPGEHAYPFRVALPVRIPPSFEGAHGKVRYRVKGKVDRPLRLDDVVKTHLTVLGDVDLNLQPGLREPAERVTEKTLCCCCCRSGPLSLVVHVPRTGLVPGQSVDVTAEVDNATGTRVDGVVCKLSQKLEYKAERKVKRRKAKMAALELGSVEPRRSATWTRALRLPRDLPPSGLPHCNIIQVSYCLAVKAHLSGPHVSPSAEIPVVIGTVPFRDLAAEPSAPPFTDAELPPPPFTDAELPPPPFTDAELPPPSFEEATSRKQN